MTPADCAISYLRIGLSVIPTRPEDKRPCLPWKAYQTRRPTESEVRSWWGAWPHAGVAIVCGGVSGVVVLDSDPRNGSRIRELAPHLPITPAVKTGGGGDHFYFRVSGVSKIPKVPGLLPGIDLQAEASYVLAPPTIHPSGNPYTWVAGQTPDELPFAPLPLILRHLVALHHTKSESLSAAQSRSSLPVAGGIGLDAVLARLEGVRRVGHGYVARCPSHDDQEPSLSIGTGTDGRLLMHCFAGCAFADILHAALEGAPA